VTLRIAAIQAEALPGDVDRNVAIAATWTRRAAADGTRLVIFPEAFVTGYDLGVFKTAAPSAEDGYGWLAPLQEAVDETNAVVVVNTPLRCGPTMALADLLLAPGEGAREVYGKQHLYPLEKDLFEAGAHGASLTIDGIEVALSVCYDANFPEHAAAAATDGALVYVNSGAYFPGGEHRRDLHYASRALDNGLYVFFSGLIGAPYDFIGGTAAYDPLGRVIERLGTEEGMIIVDVDPTVVENTRQDQRMWLDRRAELGSRVRHGVPQRP
jgi:predicted amidohydrolase